jgi:hypothetical protein
MSGKHDEEEENLRTSRVFVTLVRVRAVGAGSTALYPVLAVGQVTIGKLDGAPSIVGANEFKQHSAPQWSHECLHRLRCRGDDGRTFPLHSRDGFNHGHAADQSANHSRHIQAQQASLFLS